MTTPQPQSAPQVRPSETATVYRSGLTRRWRWRLVAIENGEKIAQGSQARGYSRRIDAVNALARATGCRVDADTGRLIGYRHDLTIRVIRLVLDDGARA